MRTFVARALALIAMLALTLFAMLAAFESVALDDGQYRAAMDTVGSVEASGLNDKDLSNALQSVARYLQGQYVDLSPAATIDGTSQPVFNEREIAHMRDVRALVDLEHRLTWTTLPLIAVLCGLLSVRILLPRAGEGWRARRDGDDVTCEDGDVDRTKEAASVLPTEGGARTGFEVCLSEAPAAPSAGLADQAVRGEADATAPDDGSNGQCVVGHIGEPDTSLPDGASQNWRAIGRMLGGSLALAALIWVAAFGLVALWALVDFNGAFTAFHHLFFTNDLWLLNPATDRMIRMFPEPFFIRLATIIAVRMGTALAGAGLLGAAWAYAGRRRA